MSDQANILYYLEECKKSYKCKDFLEAAVSAYWCVKYCEQGEPYGMSCEELSRTEAEARSIMRSCSRKFIGSKLSKTTFVYGTICPKLLWLYYHEHTVYEAAFAYNDVFAAIDILAKGGNGHIGYEVKSSKSITETLLKDCALQYYVISKNCKLEDFFLVYVNEQYLDEIQIQLGQLKESNVDIGRLFIKESVLSRILPLQEKIRSKIEFCKSVLSGGEPSVKMGNQCTYPYECMFTQYCKNADRDFDIW